MARWEQREVSLVVLSESLTASELGSLIGLEPDDAIDKGSSMGHSGRAFAKFSKWALDVGQSGDAAESRIGELLGRIRPAADRLATLRGDPRIHSVALWVWSAGAPFALDLTADRLLQIARLGASLKIDVYEVDGAESFEGSDSDT